MIKGNLSECHYLWNSWITNFSTLNFISYLLCHMSVVSHTVLVYTFFWTIDLSVAFRAFGQLANLLSRWLSVGCWISWHHGLKFLSMWKEFLCAGNIICTNGTTASLPIQWKANLRFPSYLKETWGRIKPMTSDTMVKCTNHAYCHIVLRETLACLNPMCQITIYCIPPPHSNAQLTGSIWNPWPSLLTSVTLVFSFLLTHTLLQSHILFLLVNLQPCVLQHHQTISMHIPGQYSIHDHLKKHMDWGLSPTTRRGLILILFHSALTGILTPSHTCPELCKSGVGVIAPWPLGSQWLACWPLCVYSHSFCLTKVSGFSLGGEGKFQLCLAEPFLYLAGPCAK